MGPRPKIERRHREAEAGVRKYLRTAFNGHADPKIVTPRQVSDETGIYLSTVSTIMTYLATKVAGTGLTQLKPGTYEYIWIEDTLAQPEPEPEVARHPKPRRMDCYEYMAAHRGRVWSLRQIGAAIGAPVSSVSSVMKDFADQDNAIIPIISVGTGLYMWPLSETEREAALAESPAVLAGRLGEASANGETDSTAASTAASMARVHAASVEAPTDQQPEPDAADLGWLTPEPQAQPTPKLDATKAAQPPWVTPSWPEPNDKWVERLAQTSDGTWLARDHDGKPYKLVAL